MHAIDWILLAVIAAVLLLAVRARIRRKRSGKGCCGDCHSCGSCPRGRE